MNREDAVEAGDLEDLADVLVGADDRERSACGTEPLHPSHEHAQGRRVDERRVRQIDDDLLLPLLDDLNHALLELGRRVEVDFASELDHVRVGVDLLILDLEVHVAPWWSVPTRSILGGTSGKRSECLALLGTTRM